MASPAGSHGWGRLRDDHHDVNNANFGVLFVVDEAGVNTAILRVDHVQITVWYQ